MLPCQLSGSSESANHMTVVLELVLIVIENLTMTKQLCRNIVM